MENASKALLIAGAILLVILIISLGLVVYNQAKESVGGANLNQQEIEAFNSKFTSYEDTSVSGSQVNQLIQTVISSNQAAKDAGESTGVTISFPSIDTTKPDGSVTFNATNGNTIVSTARVNTGRTYNVKIDYKDGLVSKITVTLNP